MTNLAKLKDRVVGKLEDCEVVDYKESASKEGNGSIHFLTIKHNDKSKKVALVGTETAEKVMADRSKEDGDKTLISIPSSKLAEDPIWINNPY